MRVDEFTRKHRKHTNKLLSENTLYSVHIYNSEHTHETNKKKRAKEYTKGSVF